MDPTLEPVLEPQEGNEKGGNLEAENGENLLEISEAMIAADSGLEAALEPEEGNETPGRERYGVYRNLSTG